MFFFFFKLKSSISSYFSICLSYIILAMCNVNLQISPCHDFILKSKLPYNQHNALKLFTVIICSTQAFNVVQSNQFPITLI